MPETTPLPPVEIAAGVWNMTPGFAYSYLVVGSENALLIDSGMGRDDLLQQIARITDKPVSVVTTHGHGDHVGGHSHFDSVWIGAEDLPMLDDELRAKAHALELDRTFDLGGGEFAEFVALPGHTPGSIGVLLRSRRLFFTGDMICNGTIFMIEGQCDFERFIESMDVIAGYADAVDSLVTCHGEPNMLPVSHAEKQKQAAKRFLDGSLRVKHVESGLLARAGTYYLTEDKLGFFRP
ncbi:MAG: MBL fold metallo-hydrolase [Oscillospiraceae bacterium]|jgi:glyoxylase-like metal-dependent hydrolase (beta-lactamase superfamily II)|nr:MBL fold metallo-hydrolase [Oscillospiraceae bacterium]